VATGTCSNPAKVDGKTCDSGSGCAEVGQCNAGVCVGTPLSSFSPGATLWTTPVEGQLVFTKYADDQVSWSFSELSVTPAGRVFFGTSYYVPGNVPASEYGNTVFAVDRSGRFDWVTNHEFQPSHLVYSASLGLDIQVLGEHYVVKSYLDSFDANMSYLDSYLDSDVDELKGSPGVPPPSPPLYATSNAAGDLLIAGVNGADLRRIDAANNTVYIRNLDTGTSVQAGAAGDAYLRGAIPLGLDLGCGPVVGPGYLAARLGPTGQCVWSRAVPAWGTFLVGAHDYLKGTFQGTIDLGCGPMTSPVADTPYIAAVDAAGACVWSRSLGSFHASLLPSGDLLVTGPFAGTVDVGCGPVTSGPDASYLVARINSTGVCMWNRNLAVSNPSVVVGASGNIAVGAAFGGTVDIGAGPLTSSGVTDLAVAMLDGTTGTIAWSNHLGGAGAALSLYDFRIDDGDGVLVTGFVNGTVDLGGGPVAGSFALRLDGVGVFRWQRPLNGRVAYDACGATTFVALTDTCANCGPFKYPTFTVERIAP
jgi:hypothetical protein